MSGQSEERIGPSPPSPADLPAFLPYAANRLSAYFDLVVLSHQIDEVIIKQEDTKKKPRTKSESFGPMMMHSRVSVVIADSASSLDGAADSSGPGEVVLSCGYDTAAAVHELVLRRGSMPRLLLRILALCLRFHPHLTRLMLRGACLSQAALPDLRDLVRASHVTDLCLDNVPAPDDYGVLLQDCPCLRRLSLDCCELGDGGCASVAAALTLPAPAAASLLVLSLASNGIGCAGAAALAAMLRSNRTLRHLNLAGNRITDTALRPLLTALVEFSVPAAELRAARGAQVAHLWRRRAAVERWLAEMAAAARAQHEARATRRRPAQEWWTLRLQHLSHAELMAEREVGEFRHPLLPPETERRDGWPHAPGNTTLASLNVAYNQLGHDTLRLLAAVLARQAGCGAAGLVRVWLAGNPLPWQSAAAAAVGELLARALVRRDSQVSSRPPRSKSRPLA